MNYEKKYKKPYRCGFFGFVTFCTADKVNHSHYSCAKRCKSKQANKMATIIIFYDTETTGLATATCEVLEIAAINDEDITQQFNELIFAKYIPAEVSRIHGIKVEHVKDKPPIKEQMMKFTDFIETQHKRHAEEANLSMEDVKLILVGHNANRFDNKIMVRLVHEVLPAEYQEKWRKWYFADTLGAIKATHPEHKSNGLDALSDLYVSTEEKPAGDRHRALYDVLILSKIMYSLPNSSAAFSKLREQMKLFDEFPKKSKKRKTMVETQELSPPSSVAVTPNPLENVKTVLVTFDQLENVLALLDQQLREAIRLPPAKFLAERKRIIALQEKAVEDFQAANNIKVCTEEEVELKTENKEDNEDILQQEVLQDTNNDNQNNS